MSVLNSADGRSRPKGHALSSDWKSLGHYYERAYRPDIDGLRAIAVISVIAYHFHIGPLPGGFIGVDVFFVISGYLITGVIAAKLDVDAFSFLDFYQRRIRRIFPALATMLLFMLVSGLTILGADELFRVSASRFDLLYRSIAVGAAFVTNFAQLRETTYFTQSADAQPLLHLWSLAIEEQFYIVWPLLLYGTRVMRVQYLPLALAIAAVSFAINLLTVHTDPMAAFYSPLSRAWELMLGAALACVSTERIQNFPVSATARSAIGLVVIMVALFVIRGAGFPGWAALAPTIATVLVISAGPKSSPNQNILGAKTLVWVGLISYPLYLWHWPALLIFDKYSPAFEGLFLGRELFKAAVLLCCVAASWLTYRFVEVPFRFGAWKDARHTAALALSMVAIALIGVVVPGIVQSTAPMTLYQRDTMSVFRRVAAKGETGDLFGNRACFRYRQTEMAAKFLQNNCLVRTHEDRKTAFLVGDSHSASLSLGLRPLFEHYGMNFLQVSSAWCGEPISRTFESPVCEAITDLVMKTIAEVKPDLVIVDAQWLEASGDPNFIGDDYFAHLIAKLNDVLRLGAKRIAVVGEIPNWLPSLPESLALSFVRNDEPIPQRTFIGIKPKSLNIDVVMRTLNYPSGASYFSMKDVLCNEAGCLTNVGPDLEHDLVVWDYGHLTAAASALVAHQLIEPALAGLINTPSAMAAHYR